MFRVEWLQEALDDLTRIWTKSDSALRHRITSAVHVVDQGLQRNPYDESESRGDENRVLFEYPLGFEIEVDLQQKIVWVLHVWRFRQRGE
jgi:hypothetical protein